MFVQAESLSDGGELATFNEGISVFLLDESSSADIMKHSPGDKNLNLGPRIVEATPSFTLPRSV